MSKIAHTAEHIFVRSLQNLNKDLRVKKVEHGEVNKVYIKIDNLTIDDIHRAEVVTNKIIDEGRVIKEYTMNSLEEAKKSFPNLRAYEERIEGKVRVIEIDGYDYAACIKEHAKNSKECEFFIVKYVTKEKDTYCIEFLVGKDAKLFSLDLSTLYLKLIDELNIDVNRFYESVKSMKSNLYTYKRRCVELSKQLIDKIDPIIMDGIRFYKAELVMVEDKVLMEKVGELIKQDNTVVLVSNKQEDRCNIIIASSDNLNVDSLELIDMLRDYGGKGGGKKGFATGYIPLSQYKGLNKLEEALMVRLKGGIHGGGTRFVEENSL